MRRWLGPMMVALVAVLAGCGSDSLGTTGATCRSSEDCAPGLLCDFGRTPHKCEPSSTAAPDMAKAKTDMAAEASDMAVPAGDMAGVKSDMAVRKMDMAVPKVDMAVPKMDMATRKIDMATGKVDMAP